MKRAREEKEPQEQGKVINQEDAALYDRQIRLWGAASQQKIFQARVLVYGMTGVGAEIVKNLVLAGVGEVTVIFLVLSVFRFLF